MNEKQAPLNPCWCCGEECMFCPTDEKLEACTHIYTVNGQHWCTTCKFGGVPGHACDSP